MATQYAFGQIVTSGLVLCLNAADKNSYPGSGTTWTDLSGNSNNGTLTNGPTFNSGNGGSIVFDGVDDYGTVPINLSNTNVLTLMFWLYWNTNANDDDLAMEYTPDNNTNPGSFFIDPNASTATSGGPTDKAAVRLRGNVGYSKAVFDRPTASTWHNWTVILDMSKSTNEIDSIYIDNVLQTVTRPENSNNTGNFANSTLYLMSRNGSSLIAGGRMANLMIYNRALSATEILQNYNATKTRFGL